MKCLRSNLTFDIYHPVDSILAAMGSKLKDLLSITINNESIILYSDSIEISLWPCSHKNKLGQLPIRTMTDTEFVSDMHCDGNLDIIFRDVRNGHELLHNVLEHCKSYDISPSVFLFVENNVEVSHFFHNNIQKLFLLNHSDLCVMCPGNIPQCPNLTHLYVVKAWEYTAAVEISYMIRLHEALTQGNRPDTSE